MDPVPSAQSGEQLHRSLAWRKPDTDQETQRWAADAEKQHEAENAARRVLAAPRQVDAASQERLGKIFGLCDVAGNGAISAQDLKWVVRRNPEVAQFFGLPAEIRFDDGSSSRMDQLVRSLDTSGRRDITLEDFSRWYAVQLAPAVLDPFDARPGESTKTRRRQLQNEETLGKIFGLCDPHGIGTINKRSLIFTVRQNPEVAEFFGLPSIVRQEDGSRDRMERLFQSLDTNGDREITWMEFTRWYDHARRVDAGVRRASGCHEPEDSEEVPRALSAGNELSELLSHQKLTNGMEKDGERLGRGERAALSPALLESATGKAAAAIQAATNAVAEAEAARRAATQRRLGQNGSAPESSFAGMRFPLFGEADRDEEAGSVSTLPPSGRLPNATEELRRSSGQWSPKTASPEAISPRVPLALSGGLVGTIRPASPSQDRQQFHTRQFAPLPVPGAGYAFGTEASISPHVNNAWSPPPAGIVLAPPTLAGNGSAEMPSPSSRCPDEPSPGYRTLRSEPGPGRLLFPSPGTGVSPIAAAQPSPEEFGVGSAGVWRFASDSQNLYHATDPSPIAALPQPRPRSEAAGVGSGVSAVLFPVPTAPAAMGRDLRIQPTGASPAQMPPPRSTAAASPMAPGIAGPVDRDVSPRWNGAIADLPPALPTPSRSSGLEDMRKVPPRHDTSLPGATVFAAPVLISSGSNAGLPAASPDELLTPQRAYPMMAEAAAPSMSSRASSSGSPAPQFGMTTQSAASTAMAQASRHAMTIGSELFKRLDDNKDGIITRDEIEQAFAMMDIGHKGNINKDEFKKFCEEARRANKAARAAAAAAVTGKVLGGPGAQSPGVSLPAPRRVLGQEGRQGVASAPSLRLPPPAYGQRLRPLP